MSTSIGKPPGYEERCQLALAKFRDLPGHELASLAGVSEATVSRWRSRLTVPSDPATLARLARVDLGLLFAGPTEVFRVALDAAWSQSTAAGEGA